MINSKPVIKVKFVDFWSDFYPENFAFHKLLTQKYELIESEEPDLLFYSTFGFRNSKYRCMKIFYTGENIRPDFLNCDYAFSFDYSTNPKNYRLPLYFFYDDINKLLNRKTDTKAALAQKNKFCCFVVSNPKSTIRNDFFTNFSKLKHIDSGGSVFNNIGGTIDDKRTFIKDYKFVIAFENESYPGYTTEKIFEPLLENSVPIYWGNPLVAKDFNPKSFINCHDFNSFEEVMEHVLMVDRDNDKYLDYITQPPIINNELNVLLTDESIFKRLEEIVSYHQQRNYSQKMFQQFRPVYSLIKTRILKNNRC